MSRALGTTNAAQTVAATVRPAVLCELAFIGDPVRVHSGIGSFSWDSKTWAGVGDFGGVSDVEEGADISARGITLTLSGVPSELLAHSLATQYRGRGVKLWLGFLNESGAFVANPYQIFGGRMDTMTIEDSGETSTISVQCESRLIDLRRPRVSRYTHEEQIARHPGDLGLEFVARLAEKPLYWGIPNATSSGSNVKGPPIYSSLIK